MRDQLIPRLQRTYDDLNARSIAAVETEAIVSALIEELEDINDAVESSKNLSLGNISEDREDLLEAEIIELLKGLPGRFSTSAFWFATDDGINHRQPWQRNGSVKP